jgi:tRNA A37 threonylcarbamoyladenosine synthetase subunit TsaC/SUA5/YrdC
LLATTLIPPGETEPLNDAEMILEHFAHGIAAVIDAGACPSQPTTVVDMTGGDITVVRQGRGDPAILGL